MTNTDKRRGCECKYSKFNHTVDGEVVRKVSISFHLRQAVVERQTDGKRMIVHLNKINP